MSMSEQPITNNNQLQNQRVALAQIEEIMQGYEHDLARSTDPEIRESIRTKLFRVYKLRFNLLHAIQIYLRQQRQSA